MSLLPSVPDKDVLIRAAAIIAASSLSSIVTRSDAITVAKVFEQYIRTGK